MSWDGTTPGESFCPGMERFQGSHFITGQKDSRGVILSLDVTTPGEPISTEIGRLQGSHYVLGYNNSRGVLQY